jgi:hypothetical protein
MCAPTLKDRSPTTDRPTGCPQGDPERTPLADPRGRRYCPTDDR